MERILLRRGLAMRTRTLLLFSMLLLAGCSAASRPSRLPAPDRSPHDSPVVQSPIQPGDRADGLPAEAFELLTKSMDDSCSACARDFRRQAFQLLEERFPPGVILRSDSLCQFTRAPGSEDALVLASQLRADPKLTFRFHTAANHLVGIAESDMTDESVAARCRAAIDGAALRGALEIVVFEYGDGPTFLYHASNNSVEVQCQILEIGE